MLSGLCSVHCCFLCSQRPTARKIDLEFENGAVKANKRAEPELLCSIIRWTCGLTRGQHDLATYMWDNSVSMYVLAIIRVQLMHYATLHDFTSVDIQCKYKTKQSNQPPLLKGKGIRAS